MSKIQPEHGHAIEVRYNKHKHIQIEVGNNPLDSFYSYLTPTEARELITMLTAAIAEAEKQKEQ